MIKPLPDYNYLKKIFHYNSKTGIIKRIDRKNSNGSIDKGGYIILKIKGLQYKAHRIIWKIVYKEDPKNIIDHINRNKKDNRIKNLRDVLILVNVLNKKKKRNKITGEIGIYYDTTTKGLLAKYTTRVGGKTYRFRKLENAKIFRKNELKKYYERKFRIME